MPAKAKYIGQELIKFLEDSEAEEYKAFDSYKEFSEFAKTIGEKEISKILLSIAWQELEHANKLSDILSIIKLR